MSAINKIVITGLLALIISGCSSTTKDPSTWTPEEFYNKAQESLELEDYETTIKHLEDLEVHHPFSPYTQQGQLEIAYAYYKYDEPESAIAAADRYIKLYPRSKKVDYAIYLKGVVNFNRGISDLDLVLNLDPSKRSPRAARDAFQYFSELVRRFPKSKYAGDAKKRMIYLRNNLAAYELHVADYNMRRGSYVAAANRSKYILENYPQTPAIPEALATLIQAYRKLNMNDLADDTFRVLRLNYPDYNGLDK